MNNFIKNNIVIFVILSIFYYFCSYNKKIVENMAPNTNLVDISGMVALTNNIIKSNNSDLVLPFSNVNFKKKVNIGNELIIGNIILRDDNGVLVIDKIKTDVANIGNWKIRDNKIGVIDNSDIIIANKDIHFVDYNTDNWINSATVINPPSYNSGKYSKIYTNNIETSEIVKSLEPDQTNQLSLLPQNQNESGTKPLANPEDAYSNAILLNMMNIKTPNTNKTDSAGGTTCGLRINNKDVICKGMPVKNTLVFNNRQNSDSHWVGQVAATGTF